MKNPSLKFKIYGLLIVYMLAWFGQSLMPFFQSDIFANEKKATTNVVALIIDKNLYTNNLKDSVDWYATNYIQQKISNSKAIIFPINVENIKARDIAKMIESMYYDGIEKEPTTLKWIVLIWDKIPLPVVNDNWAIFPTILPYTDFDNPKYYWDTKSNFFVPNNVPKSQAEIRQSIINIWTEQIDYIKFFDKLKDYNNNPNNYIGNKIWYDDFIDQQTSFNKINLPSYINKFLFAEDLAYHRYNPLLIDIWNKKNNKKTSELTQNLANLTWESWSYANQVSWVFSWLLADYNSNSWNSSNQIPTVFVDDSLKWFQKPYQDLYWITSTARMRDNILSAWRRNTANIDSHMNKIEYYDQLYTKQLWESRLPLLVEINKQLEDKIISIVKQKQYPLRIWIPVNWTIEKHAYTKIWSGVSLSPSEIAEFTNSFVNVIWSSSNYPNKYYKAWIYEAFYYGKNASTITWIDQTSIFVWTPNPINNDINNIQNITGIDTTRWIGSSYGILSQFVEANRWYVSTLAESDMIPFNNGACSNIAPENRFSAYVNWVLGWNTPLNLTWSTSWLEIINKRYDRWWVANWIIANLASLDGSNIFQAWSIFNIAWSKKVSNVEPWMLLNNIQWGFLQRVVFEDIEYNPFWFWDKRRKKWKRVDICNTSQIDSEALTNHDILSTTGLYQTWYSKQIKINGMPLITSSIPCPANPSVWSSCFPISELPQIPGWEYIQKQELNYKTIDSLSIHNSPNPNQINQLKNTTEDRPIDSIRYLSFKWIGWDRVRFEFPNLYNISVYKTDLNNSWSLLLKDSTEIKESIRQYLQNVVTQYNNTISNQISKQANYFNSNSTLFTTLWIADPLATPARPYILIDNNILNSIINDEMVETIAQILYIQNSIIPKKNKVNNLQEEIEQLENISNITNKKKEIIKNYITKQNPSTPLSLPWYQEKWYELISITSNWDDSLSDSQEPFEVRRAREKINEYETYQTNLSNVEYWSEEQDALKEACASKYWEPVPLVNLWDMSFPWFDMFACWLKRIWVPKVTFDFKNAQWPVLTDSFFKDFVSESTSDQYNITNNNNNIPSSEEKEILDAISIKLSSQSYLLDPSTPISLQPQLSIEKTKENFNDILISFSSTWTNCSIINNKNLCTQTYSTTLSSEPILLAIWLETKKSGYSDITIKSCKKNTSICTTQNYLIQIIPGPVKNISIGTPYDKILTNSPVPLILQAKDEYSNTIPFSLIPYTLSVTAWSIQGRQTTMISDFREIQELQGPNENSINTINILNKDSQIISSKTISFSQGKIKVSKEDNYLSVEDKSINYTLPKKKSLVYINKNYTNISLLPKLWLELKDINNWEVIAWPIIIQSEKGMFDIYRVDSLNNTIIPNTWLELTNNIIFNWRKEYIVLKPKGKSNKDKLIIKYPNWEQEAIDVNIFASNEASSVILSAENDIYNNILPNNNSISVKISVYDDWGNTVTAPTLIKSNAYWAISFSGVNSRTTLIPAWWNTSVTLTTSDNWWAWYIVSDILNNSSNTPWILKVKVEQTITPKENINGLYLNMMWTDRGNLYYNNNSNHNTIPNIFQKSDKLLVATTQLTDPNKIKYSILQVWKDWEKFWKEINNREIKKRGDIIIIQNNISQKEVIIWTINDFTWSNNLTETTVVYNIDNNISVTYWWSAWSTNSEKIITLIEKLSIYRPNKINSIEESIDSTKNIWWRSTQEHLTQFWQWKSVWESTMLNSSEFLVNYWDPLIARITQNTLLSWANVDDWPWQSIVNEPSRTVLKALSIDVNNDWLKDIVTVFSNWEVIWSKQYWWKQLFVEMWPLLKIFGTIKDVFGVNAQWDWFDDIMVQSEDDTLRIYTNKLWLFDVDGFPVCINTENEQANSLSNIDQRFVEDMDNDGLSDIIINQEWQVKIIYWWSSNNWYSYISQFNDYCDQNRQARQNNSVKKIETLATQIAEWNIVDNSLIRRKWLIQINDSISSGNIEDTTINNSIENSINQALQWPIPNFSSLPLQEITNQASSNLSRRSVSPIEYISNYESNNINKDDIRYINTSQLTNQDQVRVYKKYQDVNWWILRKDDIVKVTISILWLRNDPMTYIDRIQWPWIVKMDSSWTISWWNNWTLPTNATYEAINPQWWFMFAVDNITLWSNNSAEFSYTLVYQWWASTKIKINDRNNDEYKDISIYPLDWCSKFLWTFINNKSLIRRYRDYNKEFINLEDKLNAYDNATQQNSQNYISGMTNAIQNITGATGPNADIINNILNNVWSEQMQFWNFLQNTLTNALWEWWTSINLNVQLLWDFDQEVSDTIKKWLDQICNWGGGEQSCWSWLPIPFNMAFLSPWEFNIMGCKPKVGQIDKIFPKDSWFPVFAFPATFQLPVVAWFVPIPLPFPFWWIQKGPTDEYWYFWFPLSAQWPPQPTPYSSVIRIYMSPTLTQQMGMAICMWPQIAWSKIPAPFNALWGNCIVSKVNMPTSSCTNNDPNWWEWNLSDQDLLDLSEFWACTQSKTTQTNSNWEQLNTSPFKVVSYNNNTLWNPFPPWTYFWIINFEKTPIVLWEENSDDGVILKWGKEVQPQVQWWNKKSKWLVACIVNDWLDRQTNYIINNFTNMQIGVYLPDLNQIWEWFENIGEQINNSESNTWELRKFFQNFWTSGDWINNNIDTFSGNLIQTVRNYSINQSSLQQLSNGINNPFDELAKMFEQTPLVRINTIDVPVNIPMIYAEDIAKYESYLKTWIERNNETIKDWETIIQWSIGLCNKDYDISWNSSSINNQIVLNKAFFDDLYKKLKKEKEKINEKIEKKKELYKERNICKENKWDKENENCKKIMNTFNLDNQWLQDIELKLDAWEKINNQCVNLFFDSEWDLNGNFKNLFSIIEMSSSLENNIRENIKTLDQYKRFPLQLYQWIHVVDRYLSEITTTVDNFLWSITLRLNTNATRFEQYVDAIITISTALQTRQAILDLSVDRQRKCSTCTVDNYDAYACSLWFLCGQLKLPILRLPPFKIPNIYIDLSHIDIGMDINLPKFQFTPTSVPLVEIPNLPQPPSIVINWDIAWADLQKILSLLENLSASLWAQIPISIPRIPLLPTPPTLPELPSFIPNINIELPVLPPAPKIPKIAPEIETVINAVSFFSELYCIVKWWIWLVWESNVKTRIEQLTQRTYEIPLFDNINLSKDMSYQQDKLEGFDFQIDAYVNFTMNFNGVYSLIKWLADSINEQTKKITERDWWATQTFNKINNQIQEINDNTQQNINIWNPLWFIDIVNDTSIDKEQKNIKKITDFLINDSNTPVEKKQNIIALSDRLNSKTDFKPQVNGLVKLQKEIKNSIHDSRESLSLLQNKVKDYNNFMNDVALGGYNEFDIYSGKQIFVVNLFTWDTNRIKENKDNVMKDYINLQKTLLSHYKKWIKQVSNNQNKDIISKINRDIDYLENWLILSENIYTKNQRNASNELVFLQKEYDAKNNLIYNNQAATCSTLWNFTTIENQKNIAQNNTTVVNSFPYFSATAQAWWTTNITSPSINNSTSNLYDFSSYKNNLMIQFTNNWNNQYINVLKSEYFTKNNKWYEYIDINNDNQKDVIRRDDKNVRIKYWLQNSSQTLSIHNTTTNKYVAPIWENTEQRAEDTTDGYMDINNIKIKLYNKDRSVKNLRVSAQDYDSFTISWTNSERQQSVKWYILEINKIPDLYHLKWHNDVPNNMKSQYVLFVPKGEKNSEWYISIKNQLQTRKIKDLLTGTLIDIVEYTNSNNNISYSFTDIPRSRFYTRIASIETNWDIEKPIYTISSPRSHHVVAGKQIIADEKGPEPEVELQRVITNTIVDSWLSPQWLVNTRYNIIIKREDPNWIIENRIETTTWGIISQLSWWTNILSWLYFNQNTIKNYLIWARDTNNNITKEQINLTINVPTISIDDIIYENTPLNGINIISSITNGMDEGIVKFERKRNNLRSTLSNPNSNEWFNYILTLDQTNIMWGLYNQSKNISFFSPNGTVIAYMDKDNWSISISPEYESRVVKNVDLTSNTPIITLYDTVSNNIIFTIKQNTSNTELVANQPYTIKNLSWSMYWSFSWGKCISWLDNNCRVITSPNWAIVIPSPYHTSLIWEYSYNNNKTKINFKNPTGENVWSVTFNAFIK